MRRREHDERPSPAFFGAAGWLFADLLLALAMIFLVANSRADIKPLPTPVVSPTVTPSPTPLPKPPVLDLHYITVTIQVDYGALNSGDTATVAKVEHQIRTDSRLRGRRAGLVLTFGGSQNGSNATALQAAKDMDKQVLQDLGGQNYVFNGTVYREFFATDKPAGTIELDVYVFKL